MKKNFITKLGGLIVLLFLLLPLNAMALGQAVDSLFFKLSDDSVFIKGTISGSDTLAQVSFSAKYEGDWSGTLTGIDVRFTFDNTKLIYVSADSVNWDGTFSVDTSSISGTMILEFSSGTITTFDTTQYTDYANIRFKLICQAELNTNDLDISQTAADAEITVDTGVTSADFSPIPANFDNGTIKSADYIGTFVIHDSAFSGGCGQTVTIPIYATTNFITYSLQHWIKFNLSKLEFAGVVDNPNWDFFFYSVDTANSVIRINLIQNAPGMGEFSNEPAYSIKFKLLEDLKEDTALLRFDTPNSWLEVYNCNSMSPDTYPDTAVISLADSAVYKMAYSGGSISRSDHDGMLTFHMLMKNSFNVGFADGETNDTAMIVNVDFGTNLNFDGVDSTYESVKFSNTVVDDTLVAIYQVYDAAESNYIGISSSLDTIMRLDIEFDSAGFVADWNDRYLHPKFVDDFTGSRGSAIVPDTGNCIEADSLNGLLRFWGSDTFDSVEVEMGQFQIIGHTSSTPCTYHDLYVRNTFDLDSFTVTISVGSGACIYSITDKMTGVQVSGTTIKTNTFWVTLSAADTLIKICRIHTGISGSCLQNKPYSIYVSLSNAKMWDDSGDEHFVDANGGNGSARCSGFGTGCFACSGPGGGDPDLKVADDGNLPTEFALYQNFPNPFNPTTTISFDLPVSTDYELVIYNILGQSVKTFTGHGEPGRVSLYWNASNVSSGVYLYKLIAGDYTETKKMLLLR